MRHSYGNHRNRKIIVETYTKSRLILIGQYRELSLYVSQYLIEE